MPEFKFVFLPQETIEALIKFFEQAVHNSLKALDAICGAFSKATITVLSFVAGLLTLFIVGLLAWYFIPLLVLAARRLLEPYPALVLMAVVAATHRTTIRASLRTVPREWRPAIETILFALPLGFSELTGDDWHYIGDLKDGARHGRGECIWLDGRSYAGDWCEDKPHGQGKIRSPNARETYCGHVKNGERDGYGECTYADGSIYIGEWCNSKPHGHGMLTSTEGNKNVGEWRHGILHGHGKLIHVDGSVYVGEWHDNKRNGHGKFTSPNGSVHVGEWRDHLRNGLGKSTSSDGNICIGEWRDDDCIWDGKQAPSLGSSDVSAQLNAVPLGIARPRDFCFFQINVRKGSA